MWRGSKLPRHCHPLQFPLKCFAFPGAETARKQFLLRGGKLPSEEIAAFPPYMPAETNQRERAAALSRSPGDWDGQGAD